MKRIIAYITCMVILSCNNNNTSNKNNHTKKDSSTTNSEEKYLISQVHQYPDSIRLYDKLIDYYTSLENYASAISWCDFLITKDSEKNFSYFFIKGDLYRKNKQYDSSIRNYEVYLNRFPDDEEILLNLANVMAESGKEESLKLAARLEKDYPNLETRSNAFFIKGIFYSRTHNYSKAIENFDHAINVKYSFWEAYLEKSICYYDLKEYDKSIQVLQQLQQINPSYPDAFYWIGKCKEALNKKDEALKNYETAYALDNTFKDAKEKIDSLKRN